MHHTNTGSIYRQWKIRAWFLRWQRVVHITVEPWTLNRNLLLKLNWNRMFAPFQHINSRTDSYMWVVYNRLLNRISRRIFSRVVLITNKTHNVPYLFLLLLNIYFIFLCLNICWVNVASSVDFTNLFYLQITYSNESAISTTLGIMVANRFEWVLKKDQ